MILKISRKDTKNKTKSGVGEEKEKENKERNIIRLTTFKASGRFQEVKAKEDQCLLEAQK